MVSESPQIRSGHRLGDTIVITADPLGQDVHPFALTEALKTHVKHY